jgi:hypothetical protein
MSVITPYHWYIVQRSGKVYLYHMPTEELVDRPLTEVLLASYSVDRNMTLHMYAEDGAGHLVDYVLIKERQHQEHRQRSYDFAVEFAAWNMRRNEAAYAS